jgi:predicted DNA-binding protein (MmcQ/YjbR family)
MNQESIRAFCKKLPYATENVQWGYDLCFKVGGKLFCVLPLEPAPVMLSFKASAENFHQLQEIEGVIPAPYMARAQWLALRRLDVLRDDELKELLRESHTLVFGGLTKKLRAELEGSMSKPKRASAEAKKKVPAKSARKAAAKRAKA